MAGIEGIWGLDKRIPEVGIGGVLRGARVGKNRDSSRRKERLLGMTTRLI
jgi:hypothetical protein